MSPAAVRESRWDGDLSQALKQTKEVFGGHQLTILEHRDQVHVNMFGRGASPRVRRKQFRLCPRTDICLGSRF